MLKENFSSSSHIQQSLFQLLSSPHRHAQVQGDHCGLGKIEILQPLQATKMGGKKKKKKINKTNIINDTDLFSLPSGVG